MTAAQMIETRRQKSPAEARLIAHTEAQSSAVLLAAHDNLTNRSTLDAAERITLATIADVLTARHGLDDALDQVFDAADDAGREITYHDGIVLAMAAAGVEI